MRFVELIAALKVLDMPEQSVYDKLKMVIISYLILKLLRVGEIRILQHN